MHGCDGHDHWTSALEHPLVLWDPVGASHARDGHGDDDGLVRGPTVLCKLRLRSTQELGNASTFGVVVEVGDEIIGLFHLR